MQVQEIIQQHLDTINKLKTECLPDIEAFALLCSKAISQKKVIYFCGNGGSAADSQHLAAEFVGRFQTERRGLAAIALTTDTSILTAVANDYGYDYVFSRQVEALVRPGDVVVGISTSGNSKGILLAMEKAKFAGAATVGMTGATGGKMSACCDICLKVPSTVTARVQEAHILIGHIICEGIDELIR